MFIRHQTFLYPFDIAPAFAAEFEDVFLTFGGDAGLVFVLGA